MERGDGSPPLLQQNASSKALGVGSLPMAAQSPIAGYSFRERKSSNAPQIYSYMDFRQEKSLAAPTGNQGNQVFKLPTQLPGLDTFSAMFGKNKDLSDANI